MAEKAHDSIIAMSQMPVGKPVDIKGCARCGRDHQISFREFHRPSREWTHWGMCTVNNEPVLMKFEET